MKILFATSNPGKLREAQAILTKVELVLASDYNVEMPEETGSTFEENARLKSEAGFARTGIPTLAEDSGLVVETLDGRPGIYSARYAGGPEANNIRVLKEMEGVANRKAKFVCVASYTNQNGTHTFTGELKGEIATTPKGSNGFGYDPIFLFDGEKTTAEISPEEKDRISHRGKALRAFQEWLISQASGESTPR